MGHAETVLAALEAASATLAAARAGVLGTMRIGAFPSAVRTVLPAALVALGRDYPALDLMVTELDPVDMPAALRERRLDVALLHDYDVVPAGPDPTVDSVPLLEETVFLAVEAGTHVGTGDGGGSDGGAGDPVAGSRHADWIAGTPGTLCHTVTLRLCQAAGFTPAVRHHTDDFTAVLALVAAGQGVALVPQLGAAQPAPDVRLLPLRTRRRTRVAYRRGAGSHPTVAAFVQAIRASAGAYLPSGS